MGKNRYYIEFAQQNRIRGQTEFELYSFYFSPLGSRGNEAVIRILEQLDLVVELRNFIERGNHIDKVWLRVDKRSENLISTALKLELTNFRVVSFQSFLFRENEKEQLVSDFTINYNQVITRYGSLASR